MKNEQKIRELVEQAGIQEDLVDHLKDEVEVLTYIARPQDIQKFAELIIRECADQCTTEGPFVAEVDIVSGGTQCHMFTVDLRNEKLSGREYADLLETHGITVNKNGVPGEQRSFIETSGVRIGVAAETTRGHDEKWFRELTTRMIEILRNDN